MTFANHAIITYSGGGLAAGTVVTTCNMTGVAVHAKAQRHLVTPCNHKVKKVPPVGGPQLPSDMLILPRP